MTHSANFEAPQFSLEICRQNIPQNLAREVWAATDPKRRAWILWDASPDQRPALLEAIWLNSPEVAVWRDPSGRPLAAAWISLATLGIYYPFKSGIFHFLTCQKTGPDAVRMAGCLIRQTSFQTLLALIPKPFRSTRQFAAQCGFTHLVDLPKGVFIRQGYKVADAVLMARQTGRGIFFEEPHAAQFFNCPTTFRECHGK